jgi:hypothetical protein
VSSDSERTYRDKQPSKHCSDEHCDREWCVTGDEWNDASCANDQREKLTANTIASRLLLRVSAIFSATSNRYTARRYEQMMAVAIDRRKPAG